MGDGWGLLMMSFSGFQKNRLGDALWSVDGLW
jgi:hypothetical protein